jgi:XTP/dITP diphosphohydrolase
VTRRLVCASANPGKVAELAALLDGIVVFEPRPLDVPDVVEDAPTLEGNAELKARAIADATGIAALADDTGLEVDALNGAPGVRSARFAGEPSDDAANRRLLLERLEGVEHRSARFRTVMCVVDPAGGVAFAEGVCEGTIGTRDRGERGFGYDAIFIPADGDGRTFAEMNAAEKNAISHRSRALQALLQRLKAG